MKKIIKRIILFIIIVVATGFIAALIYPVLSIPIRALMASVLLSGLYIFILIGIIKNIIKEPKKKEKMSKTMISLLFFPVAAFCSVRGVQATGDIIAGPQEIVVSNARI